MRYWADLTVDIKKKEVEYKFYRLALSEKI